VRGTSQAKRNCNLTARASAIEWIESITSLTIHFKIKARAFFTVCDYVFTRVASLTLVDRIVANITLIALEVLLFFTATDTFTYSRATRSTLKSFCTHIKTLLALRAFGLVSFCVTLGAVRDNIRTGLAKSLLKDKRTAFSTSRHTCINSLIGST